MTILKEAGISRMRARKLAVVSCRLLSFRKGIKTIVDMNEELWRAVKSYS